jgi:uncharacterized repeat protein (TIGR02543 family)
MNRRITNRETETRGAPGKQLKVKMISAVISTVMILTMLPLTSMADATQGRIVNTYGGTLSGNTVTFSTGDTLKWDGYSWCAEAEIIAPDFITEANRDNVKCRERRVEGSYDWCDWDSTAGLYFYQVGNSMQTTVFCDFYPYPVDPNNPVYSREYQYDWDGDGNADQTFKIAIDTSKATLKGACRVTYDTNGVEAGFDDFYGTRAYSYVYSGDTAYVERCFSAGGNYNFAGWYTDQACTSAYDFDSPVTKDITLYAKWSEIIKLSGTCHVQDIGDMNADESEWLELGTEGQSKRLEAFTINPVDFKTITGYDGKLMYQVHVQNIGWMDPVEAGQMAGTEGKGLRIEAVRFWLEGEVAKHYSVDYIVHVQDYGDAQNLASWVGNGTVAGTTGESKRIEELQVGITPLSQGNLTYLQYRVHVQDFGWENKWAYDDEVSGTVGQAKRLEAIELCVDSDEYQGGVQYQVHVQDYGWQDPVTSGYLSGTQGEGKRLEAIKINLTGELAEHYDIYYRVHVQDIGWLSWAKNGEMSGTAGRSARLEGIQITLVRKGNDAPGATYYGVTSDVSYSSRTGF